MTEFSCKVLDTRKTTPGLRTLEKYAVRMGGGTNHRIGLYDAALVKDNHIEATGSIAEAVKAVRRHAPFMAKVEVEAANLQQVQEALDARADVIMLDNMNLAQMAEAVRLVNKRAWTKRRAELRWKRFGRSPKPESISFPQARSLIPHPSWTST